MDYVVVQRLMGHANISTTINKYTDVYEDFKQREFDKVNKYYLEENMLNNTNLLQENYSKKHTKDEELEI